MRLISRILKRIGLKTVAWNEEFKTDHWDRGTKTDPIYAVLKMSPGSMLEMGCGTGMTPYESVRPDYTGVDISPVAIAKAKLRNPGHRFVVSTMEDYVPDQKYDVILFRESLYYAKDVQNMLNRLWLFLEPDGVFIARICNRDRHAEVINTITRNWRIKETLLLETGGIIIVFS